MAPRLLALLPLVLAMAATTLLPAHAAPMPDDHPLADLPDDHPDRRLWEETQHPDYEEACFEWHINPNNKDDKRKTNRCHNGGMCRMVPGGPKGAFTCDCPRSWTGDNCHIDVNECTAEDEKLRHDCPKPLKCKNLIGSYSCVPDREL